MVALGALWLPILVATIAVFFFSHVIWSLLQFHKKDWQRLPDEDAFLATLGKQPPPPGEYSFPHAESMAAFKDQAYMAKLNRGPVGMVNVMPNGINMARSLVAWLIYIAVVETFLAYLAGRCLGEGAPYLEVFQIVGTAAILAFAAGVIPEAIWLGRRWKNVLKMAFDGVLYGLISAGVFSWLWPS